MVDFRNREKYQDEVENVKQQAINFCSILPELFSADLDRKDMWNRIGNGLMSAVKKCGGDYEEFVNIVLEFIKANADLVASNKRLSAWLFGMDSKPETYKTMFLRVFEKKHNVILVFARALWNDIKESSKNLKEGE